MSSNPYDPAYGGPSGDQPTQQAPPGYGSGYPAQPGSYGYYPAQPPQGPPGPPGKRGKRGWSRARKVLAAVAVVIALVIVISVLGAVLRSRPPVTRAAGTPSASAPASPPFSPIPTPPTPPPSLTGPLGTTYTDTWSDGSTSGSYDVTAVRVADPAQGSNEFGTPDPGTRFVGVQFRVKGDTGYSHDDANLDATVMGSDGQSYSPVFDSITEGTNFNGGDFGVSPGQAENGYVTFQLPDGVTAASVQWQPGAGSQTQPATWTVTP